jgi:hypothetical protein
MQLPASKRAKYAATLAEVLALHDAEQPILLPLLERLVGQLVFAGRATAWARTFSRDLSEDLERARRMDNGAASLSPASCTALLSFWQPVLVGTDSTPGWDGRRTQHRGSAAITAQRVGLRIITHDASLQGCAMEADGVFTSVAWPDPVWARANRGGPLEGYGLLAALMLSVTSGTVAAGCAVLSRTDCEGLAHCINSGSCRGAEESIMT